MSSSRVSLRHSGLVLEALTAQLRACSIIENATFVAPGTQGRDAAQTRRQYHGRHAHHSDDTNNTDDTDNTYAAHGVISRELCSSARMAERRRARGPWRSGPTARFSTAAAAVPPTSSTSPPSPSSSSSVSLSLTPAAVNKIKELQEKRGDPSVGLRLLVSGGGCSGFQYEFVVEGTKPKTETETADDAVLEVDGVRLYCDEMSLEFVKGSTVDYEDDMIQSKFIVRENPNAELGCGCGSSFSVAM